MPSSVVKSYAQKSGKSIAEVEKMWAEVEKSVKANKSYKGLDDAKIYAIINGTVKKNLKLESDSFDEKKTITERLQERLEKKKTKKGNDEEEINEAVNKKPMSSIYMKKQLEDLPSQPGPRWVVLSSNKKLYNIKVDLEDVGSYLGKDEYDGEFIVITPTDEINKDYFAKLFESETLDEAAKGDADLATKSRDIISHVNQALDIFKDLKKAPGNKGERFKYFATYLQNFLDTEDEANKTGFIPFVDSLEAEAHTVDPSTVSTRGDEPDENEMDLTSDDPEMEESTEEIQELISEGVDKKGTKTDFSDLPEAIQSAIKDLGVKSKVEFSVITTGEKGAIAKIFLDVDHVSKDMTAKLAEATMKPVFVGVFKDKIVLVYKVGKVKKEKTVKESAQELTIDLVQDKDYLGVNQEDFDAAEKAVEKCKEALASGNIDEIGNLLKGLKVTRAAKADVLASKMDKAHSFTKSDAEFLTGKVSKFISTHKGKVAPEGNNWLTKQHDSYLPKK